MGGSGSSIECGVQEEQWPPCPEVWDPNNGGSILVFNLRQRGEGIIIEKGKCACSVELI